MMATKDKITIERSSDRTSGALIPQPHGGALLPGGVVGHKGGGGRPRSLVREAALLAFDERIEVLGAIADDEGAKAGDRVRAIDVLGRHAGLAKDEIVPRELIRLLAEDVQAVVRSGDFAIGFSGERTHDEQDTDDAGVFLARAYERWAMTLGAYRAGDI